MTSAFKAMWALYAKNAQGIFIALVIGLVAFLTAYQFYSINAKLAALNSELVQIRSAQLNTQIDHQRLDNFFSMKGVPSTVRHLYTYSQIDADRLDSLEGDHPEVIEHLRKYKIVNKPPPILRKNDPPKDLSRGNGPQLLHIFQNKTDGFFVECGAYDGFFLSNTFYIERLLNWQGVLIEAEANSFSNLLNAKRNAYTIPSCLSLSTKPQLSPFKFGHHAYAHIDTDKTVNDTVLVECFPIYSILLALNRTTVDLFSLDIEGHELDVLKTIPFEKVDIKVLIVEFSHIKEGKKALEDFMASKGYIIYPSTAEEQKLENWAGEDHIFIKKGCGYKETRP